MTFQRARGTPPEDAREHLPEAAGEVPLATVGYRHENAHERPRRLAVAQHWESLAAPGAYARALE